MKRVKIGTDTTVITNNLQITITHQANLYFTWFGGEVNVFNDSGEDCIITGQFTLNDGVNDVDSYTISDQESIVVAWDNGYYVTPQSTEIDRVSGMSKTVYDPNDVEGDAFNMDNMVDGTTNKVFTATEETKLAGIDTGAEVNNISDANAATLTDGSNADGLHVHSGSSSDPSIEISASSYATTTDLNTFIATLGGKKARFQKQTHTNDRQVVIENLTDTVIDFNNMTLTLPNSPTHPSITVGDYTSSEPTCLVIGGCTNLVIKNLRLDGNFFNITNAGAVNNCQGIVISASENVVIENVEADDFNYHAFVEWTNCNELVVKNLNIFDCYGKATASAWFIAGNDSLGASNSSYIDCSAKRTSFAAGRNGDQAFYINSGNTHIENLYVENMNAGIDYREGNHTFHNIRCHQVGVPIIFQSTATSNEPNVQGSKVIGTSIYGGNPFNACFIIYKCRNACISDVWLETDNSFSQNTTGILLRKFSDSDTMEGIRLTNFYVSGAATYSLWQLNANGAFNVVQDYIFNQSSGSSVVKTDGTASGSDLVLGGFQYPGSVTTVTDSASVVNSNPY